VPYWAVWPYETMILGRRHTASLLELNDAERDALAANLAKAGIQTGIHYGEPLPRTPAFSSSDDDCPAAERRARLQLSLPMHPHLTRADVEQIASAVTAAVSTAAV